MKTAKKLLAVLLAAIMAVSVMGVATFAADAESESNNVYTEADAITSGTEIAGALSATSDVDWYSFTATKTGNATISLAHAASASEYIYFYVRVYDSADDAATATDAVATVESKGTDASKDATIAVAKDATYYVAVSTANAAAVNVAYTLRLMTVLQAQPLPLPLSPLQATMRVKTTALSLLLTRLQQKPLSTALLPTRMMKITST